ncbi:MAG: asparaginase [Comamonadaceae bacterium]|nr:asparaginase [Comamonadaceae bacterium]
MFTRSTLKPFQALPFVLDQGQIRLGFGPPEIALMCGSHSGEERHVEAVERDADQGRRDGGATAVRLSSAAPVRRLRPDACRPTSCRTSCTTTARASTQAFLPTAASTACPSQPISPPIIRCNGASAACWRQSPAARRTALPRGTDGCGAPNYALPLRALRNRLCAAGERTRRRIRHRLRNPVRRHDRGAGNGVRPVPRRRPAGAVRARRAGGQGGSRRNAGAGDARSPASASRSRSPTATRPHCAPPPPRSCEQLDLLAARPGPCAAALERTWNCAITPASSPAACKPWSQLRRHLS